MIIHLLQEISLKLDGQRVNSEAQEVAIQSLSEAVSSVQEQLSRPPPRIRQRAPLTELTTSVKRLEQNFGGISCIVGVTASHTRDIGSG
jgi:hypothetical protein